MAAVDGVRDRSGRRQRPARNRKQQGERGIAALRHALTAWLSRPLADFHLVLALCGTLGVIGIMMVLSASSVTSYSPESDSDLYALFQKHLVFFGIGVIAFWLGVWIPLHRIRKLSATTLLVCLGLLALVLTPLGSKVNGSQGWFVFGPLSLQPVELAKVALALWGAHILVVKYDLLHRWRHLLVPLVPVALLLFALVMAQPDFGATVTLGVVLIALLWFAGAPKRLFAVIFTGALAAAVALALLAEYRMDRVESFLNPAADPLGKGWQPKQALYALADGGFFGKGLGQGQSKWMYLPNVQHDFIFALIGEELGLIGCLVVVGLFGLLTFIGLRVALRNLDPWIRIVAGTLTTWLVFQAAVNIGYVVGLLPITGVTLPMISYGGTSLVVTMLLFGILANCARHEPEAVVALRTQGPGKFGRLMRLPAPDPYRPPTRRRGNRGADHGGKRGSRGSAWPGSARSGRPAGRTARVAATRERGWTAPNDGRRTAPGGRTGRGAPPGHSPWRSTRESMPRGRR